MLAIEFHPETLPVVEEENNDIASMNSTEESKVFIICQVFFKLMLLACHKKSYLTKSYFLLLHYKTNHYSIFHVQELTQSLDKETRILMVGLKGAGKTTILHQLIGEIVQGYRNRYNLINCGHKTFWCTR